MIIRSKVRAFLRQRKKVIGETLRSWYRENFHSNKPNFLQAYAGHIRLLNSIISFLQNRNSQKSNN